MTQKLTGFILVGFAMIVVTSFIIGAPKSQGTDLQPSITPTPTPTPQPTPESTPMVISSPVGEYASIDIDLLCHPSYLASHNQIPKKLVQQVFKNYNISPENQSLYHIDKFIPTELEGTTTIKNLWPQLVTDFDAKNKQEALLYDQVCQGTISVSAARAKLLKTYSIHYGN